MKKFLAMTLLVFAVIIGQAAQVSAQEIYAYSDTRGGKISDEYVVKESVQSTNYGIKVTLHSVGRNFSHDKYWEVGFTKSGNDYYIIWLPSTSTTLIASGDRVIKPDYVKVLYIALS